MIVGYDVEIPQGFWRRVTQYGVPVRWLGAWIAAAILQMSFCIMLLEIWWFWRVLLGASLVLGELLLGAWLTRADADWDTLLVEQWRYHSYYEAD